MMKKKLAHQPIMTLETMMKETSNPLMRTGWRPSRTTTMRGLPSRGSSTRGFMRRTRP